jgi:lipoate-protein ligase B
MIPLTPTLSRKGRGNIIFDNTSDFRRIVLMETIAISRNELKKLMRETFIDVLTNRKDLVEDAVIEALEDIGLGIAMEEGRTGEYIDEKEFTRKLDSKVKSAK